MSINQHQFEQLTEMGISLWQSRTDESSVDKTPKHVESYLNIELSLLTKKQLFTDILTSVGLTVGEINEQDKHLDLGLFNWYFTSNPEANEIRWHEQQLFTPSIDEISKSPALKKQLWHLLGNQAQ